MKIWKRLGEYKRGIVLHLLTINPQYYLFRKDVELWVKKSTVILIFQKFKFMLH